MSPFLHDLLSLMIDGLIIAAMIGVLIYLVRRARQRTGAVKAEQQAAARMLDVPPPTDAP